MQNMQNYLIVGAVAVIAGGAGFWGGRVTDNQRRGFNFQQNQQNQRGNRGGMMGGENFGGMRGNGMVVGEVSAKDDKSITVKLNDGSSKIVLITSGTSYRMNNDAKVEDLAVGKTVSVFGTPNNDGSTTASSIELNPILRGQLNSQYK